jgi:hypothetical protein
MTVQLIINYLIYFSLCLTLPYVCVNAYFSTKDKAVRSAAVTAFLSFLYLGLYCMAFQ